MALGDEQIDRFDRNLKNRIEQLDQVLDRKIDRLQNLIDRLQITNTTAFNIDDKPIVRATPVELKSET